VQVYKEKLLALLPYIDILFGNSAEAFEFSKQMQWQFDRLDDIAKTIAVYTKENGSFKTRIVVITQGSENIIVAEGNTVTEFKVNALNYTHIVDTNGAGDAFIGGFIAAKSQHLEIEECVQTGSKCAAIVLKNLGCQFN
jgi:adenosine kinase